MKYHTDKRITDLITYLQVRGQIKNRQEFLDRIGFLKQNYRAIRLGQVSFTIEQIHAVCKAYNVSADWVFGFSKKVFRERQTVKG